MRVDLIASDESDGGVLVYSDNIHCFWKMLIEASDLWFI
jgi:hypothetical protein